MYLFENAWQSAGDSNNWSDKFGFGRILDAFTNTATRSTEFLRQSRAGYCLWTAYNTIVDETTLIYRWNQNFECKMVIFK